MAFNLGAPGRPTDRINIHNKEGTDLDENLSPKVIATMISAASNGHIPIVNPKAFFHDSDSTGNLVSIAGPPGKDGWTNEALGSVQSRFHDAHIGMGRLLMDGYLRPAQHQAAIDVIEFVASAFGKDEKKEFDALTTQLRAQPNLEPAQFRTIMEAWLKPFNPAWVFCKTETCGVWQLFHEISALIAIQYAPIPVSKALPGYRYIVSEFMTCQACRIHFLRSYDNCLFGRCEVLTAGDEEAQAKALVLWLWRTHNAVSENVIAERPPTGEKIDRRWPAYRECPGCWNVDVVNGKKAELVYFKGQTNNDQPVYNVFNNDKVYGYILKGYLGQETSRLFESIPPLRHQSAAADSPVTMTGNFLTSSCVIACGITLFVVWRFKRQLRQGSLVSTDEQELLEDPETVE